MFHWGSVSRWELGSLWAPEPRWRPALRWEQGASSGVGSASGGVSSGGAGSSGGGSGAGWVRISEPAPSSAPRAGPPQTVRHRLRRQGPPARWPRRSRARFRPVLRQGPLPRPGCCISLSGGHAPTPLVRCLYFPSCCLPVHGPRFWPRGPVRARRFPGAARPVRGGAQLPHPVSTGSRTYTCPTAPQFSMRAP